MKSTSAAVLQAASSNQQRRRRATTATFGRSCRTRSRKHIFCCASVCSCARIIMIIARGWRWSARAHSLARLLASIMNMINDDCARARAMLCSKSSSRLSFSCVCVCVCDWHARELLALQAGNLRLRSWANLCCALDLQVRCVSLLPLVLRVEPSFVTYTHTQQKQQ